MKLSYFILINLFIGEEESTVGEGEANFSLSGAPNVELDSRTSGS